jgi:hypothetical protein
VQGGYVFQLLFSHHQSTAQNGGSRPRRWNYSRSGFFEVSKEHHVVDVTERIGITPAHVDIDNPFTWHTSA